MTKGWVRVWRVAKFLDCSRDHVYDLVSSGELISVKIGIKGVRVSQESLDNFLIKNQVTGIEFDNKN